MGIGLKRNSVYFYLNLTRGYTYMSILMQCFRRNKDCFKIALVISKQT
jgi:hypothetical protein